MFVEPEMEMNSMNKMKYICSNSFPIFTKDLSCEQYNEKKIKTNP